MKRILLLSGYDAKSHRYWRQHLVSQFESHHWTVLALTDRHFSWRMGGNAFSFSDHYEKELNQSYDLIIATSMTDICGLLGLFPHLSQIPSILYFHENQMAYPANKRQPDIIHYQLNSVKSAMAAKRLIFNSDYNKKSFLTGVKKIQQLVPDGFSKQLEDQLKIKSQVIPVPLSNDCFASKTPEGNKASAKPMTVTWNHRWEHDKSPETLLKLLQIFQTELPEIMFNVIGQKFRHSPDVFDSIKTNHINQINHFGYIEKRSDYLTILQQSDVVLSTALHEFQGLAIMEAVASGCVPLLPDRLAYQNFYQEAFRYPSTPESPKIEALAIVEKLKLWQKHLPEAPDMHSYSWPELKNQYQNILMTN